MQVYADLLLFKFFVSFAQFRLHGIFDFCFKLFVLFQHAADKCRVVRLMICHFLLECMKLQRELADLLLRVQV